MTPQYSMGLLSPLKNEISVGPSYPSMTKILVDESSLPVQHYIWGLISLYWQYWHLLGQLLIHEGHMEHYLGASSSNCSQLGQILAIPTPEFDHPILLSLNIAALAPILIIFRLILLRNG